MNRSNNCLPLSRISRIDKSSTGAVEATDEVVAAETGNKFVENGEEKNDE